MSTTNHLALIAADMERQAHVIELEAQAAEDYAIKNDLREIAASHAHDAMKLRQIVIHWGTPRE